MSHALKMLLLTGVIALMLLSGCSSASKPVELSAKDTGVAQSLAIGQELRVSLQANPTTGYRWAVDGAVPTQLEQAGEARCAADSKAIGSGGTEVWTFVAKRAGKAPLRLKYWRSFEPTAPPVATFSADIEVR